MRIFLSTPSARRATHQHQSQERNIHYFYPRPPRGGRLIEPEAGEKKQEISIHALREEGDSKVINDVSAENISIHALREEGDITTAAALWAWWEFLSTPSARRATIQRTIGSGLDGISIHALREEGDRSL